MTTRISLPIKLLESERFKVAVAAHSLDETLDLEEQFLCVLSGKDSCQHVVMYRKDLLFCGRSVLSFFENLRSLKESELFKISAVFID